MQTLKWQFGKVMEKVQETPRAFSIELEVPEWIGHRAGQHVDVRLTAEDGYQTERSYSIASPPEEKRVWLTVERIADGEVSPYLTDELRSGDLLELRGPVGGYFTWDAKKESNAPLLLIAGGSGVVPLMAMMRHYALSKSQTKARLLYSARFLEDVIYRAELERLAMASDKFEVVYTLTRSAPADWTGYSRRFDRALLEEATFSPEERPNVFVCGPTPLVESVAALLQELGHDAKQIKTERFGPTGG